MGGFVKTLGRCRLDQAAGSRAPRPQHQVSCASPVVSDYRMAPDTSTKTRLLDETRRAAHRGGGGPVGRAEAVVVVSGVVVHVADLAHELERVLGLHEYLQKRTACIRLSQSPFRESAGAIRAAILTTCIPGNREIAR